VILRQQDSLHLTAVQADSIAAMNRRYNYRSDSLWAPVSRYFGLAAVAFHTAAGATEIPALREADAAAIRDRIADLALEPEVL